MEMAKYQTHQSFLQIQLMAVLAIAGCETRTTATGLGWRAALAAAAAAAAAAARCWRAVVRGTSGIPAAGLGEKWKNGRRTMDNDDEHASENRVVRQSTKNECSCRGGNKSKRNVWFLWIRATRRTGVSYSIDTRRVTADNGYQLSVVALPS